MGACELVRRLTSLAFELSGQDLYEAQARYVDLFDRTRSLSLQLYEHVHGESRDRGQAMVELLKLYSSRGLELTAKELPDHLPVFLEFLSMLPTDEAAALLGEAAHVLEALRERLKKRRSPYARVFDILVALVETKRNAEALNALLQEPDDDPDDLEALDRAWAEEQVTFGRIKSAAPRPPRPSHAWGNHSMNAVQQPLRVLTIALGAFGACWAAPLSASAQTQAAGDWIVDTRLRYESVSQDGLNDADALTLRTRLGYETRAFNGFKFLAEFEGVAQLTDDFNDTVNGNTAFATVPDPEAFELNRLQVTWAGARAGVLLRVASASSSTMRASSAMSGFARTSRRSTHSELKRGRLSTPPSPTSSSTTCVGSLATTARKVSGIAIRTYCRPISICRSDALAPMAFCSTFRMLRRNRARPTGCGGRMSGKRVLFIRV
ncbi:MAG: nitrate reductase molybdenum cofactor assembly chaperone [Caulobacteraceae bacterium]|nr:nitrate reductase molybdenum cofactor assembly chaperone [Caulobacteraceae bacterium]